jgi:hypothetical protein
MSDLRLDPHAPSGLIRPVDEHVTAPVRKPRVGLLLTVIVLVMGGLMGWLLWIAPRTDEGIAWATPSSSAAGWPGQWPPPCSSGSSRP